MIFGFLLSVLIIPGISGAGTSPRWALAGVVLPILLMQAESKSKFTAAHAFGLIFLWCAAISISWCAQFYDGLDALFKLIVMAQAFVLGSRLTDLKPTIIGFGLGIWVSSLVILFGIDVPHTTDNAGLFVNSNSMGEIAGLVLAAALFYRESDSQQRATPTLRSFEEIR